jgi:hypothetical protein
MVGNIHAIEKRENFQDSLLKNCLMMGSYKNPSWGSDDHIFIFETYWGQSVIFLMTLFG